MDEHVCSEDGGECGWIHDHCHLVSGFSIRENILNVLGPTLREEMKDNILLLCVGEGTTSAGIIGDEPI